MGQKKKRRFTRLGEGEMERFKKFLGPELAKRYAPDQLVALYYDMHVAADLLLDLWISKKQGGVTHRRIKDSANETES